MKIELPETDTFFKRRIHTWGAQEFNIARGYLTKFRTCLDLGAHVGITTLRYAPVFKAVHSFEPIYCDLLRKNTRHLTNVACHEYAVSNEQGTIDIYLNHQNTGGAQIPDDNNKQTIYERYLREGAPLPAEQQTINRTTVDSYNFINVDFIKIDVEGHTIQTLEGMVKTLETNNPLIQIEMHRFERPSEIIHTMLSDMGFIQVKRLIHIPKTGGMTLRRAPELKQHMIITSEKDLPKEFWVTVKDTMVKHNEHVAAQHARWRDLIPTAQADNCFAIIRNPWARVVSRYTFLMDMWVNNKGDIRTKSQYGPVTFEQFLDQRHADSNIPYFWMRAIRNWYDQKDHVVDERGVTQCDVLRLESRDVVDYFKLVKPLRRRNVSNTKGVDYKTFYNNQTHNIVAEWYKDDIEYFGFTFEGPATKNIWKQ